MRKSVVEKLRELKRKKASSEHMELDDLLLLLLDPRERNRRQANPTQLAFIKDPASFKAFMGPKGSAKTSSGCAAGFIRALTQPGSKGLVARNDYNDLKVTTRLRMEEMLARLPQGTLLDRTKEPPETWTIQAVPVADREGKLLDDTPSQITFAGLESLGEAGSYEFDWAFLDESSEIMDERTVTAVGGLMRNIPKWWEYYGILDYSVMLAFNPTDTFHWLYTACTGLDHQGKTVRKPWIKLFMPVHKENIRNLPSDYYERMDNMPVDQRSRLRDGQWGATFEGQAVVPEFRPDVHARPNLMKTRYDPHADIIRMWDFGFRRPYCLWAQQTYEGHLVHLRELMGENEEIEAFIHRVLTSERQWFPEQKSKWRFDYGDPAAMQRKDTGSTLAFLQKAGITLRYRTMTIEEGLRSVRTHMNRMINGEPLLQYDAQHCGVIIRAWQGGYHFKLGDGGKSLKPYKDGFYDHPADANRYGIVGHFGMVPEQQQVVGELPTSLEYRADADTFARG